jgi:hypothetical protein
MKERRSDENTNKQKRKLTYFSRVTVRGRVGTKVEEELEEGETDDEGCF